MSIQIKSTKAIAGSNVKILVYGVSGAGKTTLVRTLPKTTLLISAESGLLSLAGTDIPVIEIHNMDELMEAYNYIVVHINEYAAIAIDSFSEIAEVVLAAEKAKTKDPRQAYGALIDQMNGLIRAFRDLPITVYFSAKMEREKDDTGRMFFGPSAPGSKVGASLPYFFDEVFALRVENGEDGKPRRMLQTLGDGNYIAKDRSGKLNPWEEADLGAIISKIQGGIA